MKTRTRQYLPSLTALEDRQLLSYQYMNGSAASVVATVQGGINTTLQPTPTINHFSSFTGSVGSQFLFQVESKAHPVSWAPEATPYYLKSVHYSTPHGLSLNTTFELETAQTIPMTDTTHNFDYSWITWQDSIGGYMDATVADIDFAVTLSFYGRTMAAPPDETFMIEIDTEAPQGTLGSSWPTNGSDGFHFGLWSRMKEYPGGIWRQFNTPVSSQDPDLLVSLDGDPSEYSIGVESPGQIGYSGSGVNFAAVATNSTHVYGRFYITQVATAKAESRRVQSQFAGAWSTTGRYVYESQKDANGNYIWGLDEDISRPQSARTYGAAPGQTVSLTNPWVGDNAVYSDSPSFQYAVSSDADNFLTYMDYHLKLETSLVWQPDYGIPVTIAVQPWQLDAHYENPTVLAHPSFANAINPANWTGTASLTHQYSPVNTPKLLRPYGYNMPSALNAATWTNSSAWLFGVQISGASKLPHPDFRQVHVANHGKVRHNLPGNSFISPVHRKGIDVHHVARHVVNQKANRWQTSSHGAA